jgi:hypothetical protein
MSGQNTALVSLQEAGSNKYPGFITGKLSASENSILQVSV